MGGGGKLRDCIKGISGVINGTMHEAGSFTDNLKEMDDDCLPESLIKTQDAIENTANVIILIMMIIVVVYVVVILLWLLKGSRYCCNSWIEVRKDQFRARALAKKESITYNIGRESMIV